MDHPFDIEQDNNPSLYESSALTVENNPQTLNDSNPPPANVSHNGTNPSGEHFENSPDSKDVNNAMNGFNGSVNSPSISGKQAGATAFPNNEDDYFNNSINITNTVKHLLESNKLAVNIHKTEKLINSSVIVYLIELVNIDTEDKIVVKRRYSEFKSFRDCLNKLFPTIIIPPIPEKHSFMQLFFNSLNTDNELHLIEFRSRFFHNFLNDVIKIPLFKTNSLVLKFLDPNYELCWYNALNEPPINTIPKNLLLANPINPMDQNGLYLLLPKISNFQNSNISELYKLNLDSLGHLNDQILKLNSQMVHLKLPKNKFSGIPIELINFEVYIIHNLKILRKINKFNLGHVKNFKSLLMALINLGGNLNNFSLEIYELNRSLSTLIEKFGSIIDLNYLNYENFLINNFVPNFSEIIIQIYHYFNVGLNLMNFYKFKIYQFKILFKTKFSYLHQLANLNINNGSLSNLSQLNLNSPSINNIIKNNQLEKKKSWYQIFGGNKGKAPAKVSSVHIDNRSSMDSTTSSPSRPVSSGTTSVGGSPGASTNASARNSFTESSEPALEHSNDNTNQDLNRKIENLERELNKLDHLIDLLNNDLEALTKEIMINFHDFCKFIEKKWLFIFLSFIRSSKQLFHENLNNWTEFKLVFDQVS